MNRRIVVTGLAALLAGCGPGRIVATTAFTDRRSTGGIKAPYSSVTTAANRVLDEGVIDEVAVNPKLIKADFSR